MQSLKRLIGMCSLLCLDEMWTYFCSRFLGLLDKYVPTSTSSGHDFDPPWMTKQVLKKTRQKRKAWFKYRITHLLIDYLEYAKHRNNITAAVRDAKQSYERNLIEKFNSNLKSFLEVC